MKGVVYSGGQKSERMKEKEQLPCPGRQSLSVCRFPSESLEALLYVLPPPLLCVLNAYSSVHIHLTQALHIRRMHRRQVKPEKRVRKAVV